MFWFADEAGRQLVRRFAPATTNVSKWAPAIQKCHILTRVSRVR
jgi:hypothetical protein